MKSFDEIVASFHQSLWAIYLAGEMEDHREQCRASDDGMREDEEVDCAVYRLLGEIACP